MANETRGARGGGWVLAQLILLAAVGLAPRSVAGLPPLPEWLRPAGLLLCLAGAIVGLIGARQLGRSLTAFPRPREGGELVQTGLYSVVRHPIYLGVLLAGLGWPLLRGSAVGLALGVALGVFLDQKARREERWLERQYPGYAAYRERVRGRIMPL